MALSLGVCKGEVIKIGQDLVKVLSIGPGARALLGVKGKGNTIPVVDNERSLLLPNVYVSFGRNSNGNPSPRLCFEASRDIPISRVC